MNSWTRVTKGLDYGKNCIRSDAPLTDQQILEVAPAVGAHGKYRECSERYSFTDTLALVNTLRGEGFEPFMVAQTRSLSDERRGYAKHMLRLRSMSDVQAGKTDVKEIVIYHSHDRTSSLQLCAGVFREVCANGNVVGDIVQDIRIRHQGRIDDRVLEGAYTIVENFGRVDESMDAMKAIELDHDERILLAQGALDLRYAETNEDGDIVTNAPVPAEKLLQARRFADQGGKDLWTTFNVIQENLVRGGVKAWDRESGKVKSVRGVTGLDTNLKLNRALWNLAEGMKQLKLGLV